MFEFFLGVFFGKAILDNSSFKLKLALMSPEEFLCQHYGNSTFKLST